LTGRPRKWRSSRIILEESDVGRCSDARERLLEAGARLVHERGYTAVSVADICEQAGLRKGSFYHFFRSKRDLVLAVIDRYADSYAGLMTQCVKDSRLSACEQLRGIFRLMHECLLRGQQEVGCMRGCPVGNLALEMADRDDLIREKLDTIFARWRAGLQRILKQARAQGELNVENPSEAAEALVAHAQGAILLSKASNDPGVFDRLMNGVLAMLEGSPKDRGHHASKPSPVQ
jgi:TetR/AcrR family transcriptional regulator, transcriptional repressor for nem operon